MSKRSVTAALAALLTALGLALTGTAPASGDANEGLPGAARTNHAQITAGSAHTCVLLSGDVWCWGANGSGQLGNGTTTSSTSPVKVVGLSGVTAVAAGFDHTCAVLGDGTARCWGSGTSGQLGNGATSDSPVPVTVTGLTGVTAVSGGRLHSCAVAASRARCWGNNSLGQLGNGTFAASPVPVAVSHPANATTLSSGWGHSCGTFSDGQARCWGNNDSGQLGNPGPGAVSPTPVGVQNVSGPNAVTVGSEHACSLSSGQARCWGWNGFGQLGNGSTGGSSFGATPVTGIGGVQGITAGNVHTCALPGDGTVRCWGGGADGQLGTGGSGSTPTPGPVAGLGGTAVAVTAGFQHTCALLSDRSVRCWGDNGSGQLGDGTTTDRLTPVTAISAPGAPTEVSARPDVASATVSFKPPAFDGRFPITSYTVTASPGGITATGTGSPIRVDGLTDGTSYTFTVKATNAIGTSPASAPSKAVTPSNAPFYEIGDASVAEGNSSSRVLTFTVARFGNTAGSSTVKYSTANGTAVAPADYTAKALTTLSFAAGQTARTVSVTVKGDTAVEPDEQFQVRLSAPVSSHVFDGIGVGTIRNDDSSAPPTFSVDDVAISEGDSGSKVVTFTVTRSGSTAASASVKFRTSDGTATAPADYTAKGLTGLSFSVGQVSKPVSVTVKGDLLAEGDQTFHLDLSGATGASIADARGVATIVDDDSSAAPSFSVNDASVVEGDSLSRPLTFTITRSGNLASSASVRYATADGTAVAPGDYTAKALITVAFAAGERTKTVTVTVKGDRVVEPDETFTVNLSAPVGAVVSDATGVGTITTDD